MRALRPSCPRLHTLVNCRRHASLMVHAQAEDKAYYLGIDFGTSGARICAVDDSGDEVASGRARYEREWKFWGEAERAEPVPWTTSWEQALFELLSCIPEDVKSKVKRVAFDGTSATSILLDASSGNILADAKLYNEAQGSHTVQAAARCEAEGGKPALLHQADWLASLLTGDRSTSDWNNALKLGYDVRTLQFFPGLTAQEFSHVLPQRVLQPGSTIACITEGVSQRCGLPLGCQVAAGTTDSIAAFLASGADELGDAVTSLGSTMAVKLLSEKPVDDGRYGIYSHRLGMGWLVGGASNSGGQALKDFFDAEALTRLSRSINPQTESPLKYYPLPRGSKGERFPVNDPEKQPLFEPRPEQDAEFLHGLLESIARIEQQGYGLLKELGASEVRRVLTAGGGAVNTVWTEIRSRRLGVPVSASPRSEACYGAAMLAKRGAS